MNNMSYWTRKNPQLEVLEALENEGGKASMDKLRSIFAQKSFSDSELSESINGLVESNMIYSDASMIVLKDIDKDVSYKDVIKDELDFLL